MKEGRKGFDLEQLLKSVQARLEAHGISVDLGGLAAGWCGEAGEGPRVKVVCVAPGVKDSVDEMGATPRDQVVLVRVDEETRKALDEWVETGAVKSRSEAAALFIREGLKVRKAELDQLRDALRGVEEAREHLRTKAREVLGETETPA